MGKKSRRVGAAVAGVLTTTALITNPSHTCGRRSRRFGRIRMGRRQWWFDASGSATFGGATWGKNTLAYSNLDTYQNYSWTDIRVTRGPIAGVWGQGGCHSWWGPESNGNCNQEFVRFADWTEGGITTLQWKWLGCHEFGHTGGVGHRGQFVGSCMIEFPSWFVNNDQAFLDGHDIDSINSDITGPNRYG